MKIYTTKVPPIKCQGIKTKLVPWIKAILPGDLSGTWIEPFMGSGVVAFNVRPKKAILADSNPHLINFYNAIATGEITAGRARQFLEEEGAKLIQTEGEYYYTVRNRFNEHGNPIDFLFLNRSCFNGMIRFNKKGGFNVPSCRKPNRFAQALITKICNQIQMVSDVISLGNYTFINQDFDQTISMAKNRDLIYCDPPYIDRHADYFNGWTENDEARLEALLSKVPCPFILSTWHHNEYRENTFIDSLWSKYELLTREHFYHVGGSEKNRNPMIEALITNYEANFVESISQKSEQMQLLEPKGGYNV
ncbi:MAG: Dam family site-specific DNA-(adenine-N6)-methyltransferase [Puniceicoccaceae bacterium]|nr:MAG: Dam family site-specific DNA-(adenine-N6)-methyltransferase [Puniceicoccaceae bacterium]